MTANRALLLTVATFCLLLLGWAGPPAPAHADPSADVVRHLEVQMEIDSEGRVHVTETYEWDFGSRDGLGLRRELAQQFAWPQDNDLMRVYRYTDIDVSSPSGAPAEHWVVDDGAYLVLDIGAPDGSDDTRSGVQTYVLQYTIEGALNAIRGDAEVADQDELYWNVTGSDWDNTIERVTTTVTGPVPITDYRCFQGQPDSTDPCDAQVQGDTAAFTTGTVHPGQEQTVAVAFPPGTFTHTDPILQPRDSGVIGGGPVHQRIAEVTDPLMQQLGTYWPVPVVVLVALYGLGLVRRVRQGRDDHFLNLPPGTLPPEPARAAHPVAQLDHNPAVAVRFTPPEGLPPAVLSQLETKISAPHALTATIVDLAVRDFLSLHEAKVNRRGRPTDWDLVLSPSAAGRRDELLGFERDLLDGVFADGARVRLTTLRRTLPKISSKLTKGVTADVDDRELFTRPLTPERRREVRPDPVTGRRGRSLAWQLGLLMAVAAVGFTGIYTNAIPESAGMLAWFVVAALGLWLVLRGMTMGTSYRRSATGRALYEQGRGFKTYLRTAEADQIRFEEGIDVFSRYLPYAIVFGVAERWASVFAQLQARGQGQVHVAWYVGSQPGAAPDLGAIGTALGSFAGTVAATTGSSGGSGMGGGAGGGGGGGGGGGR